MLTIYLWSLCWLRWVIRHTAGGMEGMSATASTHTMGVMQEQGMENWHWEIVRRIIGMEAVYYGSIESIGIFKP